METITVRTEADLLARLRAAYANGTPLAAAGQPGEPTLGVDPLVLEVATRGIDIDRSGCSLDDLVFCGAVGARLAAGEPWDDFVARAVDGSWVGVEALSGMPGTVASVVAANPLRYGQSPADTVAQVRTWDRATDAQRTFAAVDCQFEPGSSRFARELMPDGTPRYVIVEASFLLKQGDLSLPDPALADLLGSAPGEKVTLARVRQRITQSR